MAGGGSTVTRSDQMIWGTRVGRSAHHAAHSPGEAVAVPATGAVATSAPASFSAPQGPMASAGCKTVVDRANAMLASAVRLREAVAEQGGTLRDPANRRLSGPQLLERVTPALEAVAGELDRFERALAATGRLWTGASCKPPRVRLGRSGLHGGEDDHIGPVVASGGVEVPATGDQPQRGVRVG